MSLCEAGILRPQPGNDRSVERARTPVFQREQSRLPKPMSLENFTSAHAPKRGAGFIETARLIAGASPPQWLITYLQNWSSSVMLDGSIQAQQPGKAEVRTRLRAIISAIEVIDREIRDDAVVAVLLAQEFGALPDNKSLDALFREIYRRAELGSSRTNLLGTGLDEKLEQLSDSLKLVTREIQDPALSDFLQAEQQSSRPDKVVLAAALTEIKRQAESALASDYLATNKGKTKSGRGRALPPGASSPRAFCAAVVLEAWAYFHDANYPAASNSDIAGAAQEYWRLCGGITDPWIKDPLDKGTLRAWRPYFREALGPSLAKMREELKRHIREHNANNF